MRILSKEAEIKEAISISTAHRLEQIEAYLLADLATTADGRP